MCEHTAQCKPWSQHNSCLFSNRPIEQHAQAELARKKSWVADKRRLAAAAARCHFPPARSPCIGVVPQLRRRTTGNRPPQFSLTAFAGMGNITSRPSSSSSTRTPQSHEDHHRTFDRHDNALSQPSQQRQPSLGSSAHHADAHVDHRSSDQPPVQPRPSRLKRLSRSFTPRSSFLPSLSSSSRESQCHPTEGNNDSGSTLQGPLHRLKDRRSSRRSQQPTSPGQPGLPLGDRTNATSQPQPQVQEASQTAPCSHPDIASPEPDFTSSRRAEGDDGAGPSPQPVAEASSG